MDALQTTNRFCGSRSCLASLRSHRWERLLHWGFFVFMLLMFYAVNAVAFAGVTAVGKEDWLGTRHAGVSSMGLAGFILACGLVWASLAKTLEFKNYPTEEIRKA